MVNERPILLAEDSEDDQMLIGRSLRKSGISNKIVIANDGVEALDMIMGRGARASEGPLRPVVALLDMKMPRLGGVDVLKQIRANAATKSLPVVILTSSDDLHDKAECYDLGANSYVRKPVDFEDFARAISSLGVYWVLVNEPPPQAAD